MNKLIIIRYRYIFLILIGIIESVEIFAQSANRTKKGVCLELNPSSTRSIRGWKIGGQMGANFGNRFTLGTFWYQSLNRIEDVSSSFFGLYNTYFFSNSPGFQMGFSLRAGFFEERFFSIIPTVEGLLKLSERVSLGSGIGYSDRHPYFDFKTSIKLNK